MIMDPNNPEFSIYPDYNWQNNVSHVEDLDLQFLNSIPFNPPDDLDLAFALSPGDESFLFSSTDDSPVSDPGPATSSSGWSHPDAAEQQHLDGSRTSSGWSQPDGYVRTNEEDESSSSDPVTRYISQMLMEENMEDKPYLCYDPLALRATEMSLYDVIGEQYPEERNEKFPSSGYWDPPVSVAASGSSNGNGMVEGSFEYMVKNMFSNENSVLQFNKGLEEAKKFLPSNPNLELVSLDSGRGNAGRKNNHERESSSELEEEEQRNRKQSAISYEEEGELSEMFDKVLLLPEELTMCAALDRHDQNEKSANNGRKKQGKTKAKKKNGNKSETADLRGLLVLCAQAVSSSDFRTANELLKQVRQHSSETGDGTQRLAHYFANGLEARLAGNSSSISPNFFYTIASKRISAAEILKAYKTHLNSCPFKKMSILFSNKMIYETAVDAKTLHVIDFGVMFGFQWPILIQLLAMRPGGPPKLRITGVELPQRGFRPTERIEEAGRRLAKYCERFNVPFEYNPIASQNWETIGLEEFKIHTGEVVAVNCLSRFKNLMEESFDSTSPRNAVMSLIRRMNPDIFVQTEINGSYNAPFFVTRFREALFHFSSLFDMFDCTVGGNGEEKERMMFEREIYGREAMNVVAAEGADRVERPETYKQWQVRNVRAGFRALPLKKELMEKVRSKMKLWYHKDFVVDQDGCWMLQGWKGRIIYATSCWVPA
ncbi:Scarecrow-like protein 33 [Linum grandiflorum]